MIYNNLQRILLLNLSSNPELMWKNLTAANNLKNTPIIRKLTRKMTLSTNLQPEFFLKIHLSQITHYAQHKFLKSSPPFF